MVVCIENGDSYPHRNRTWVGRLKLRPRVRTGRDASDMMAPEEMQVRITESAVRRIRFLRQKEDKPDGALRLRIIAGGCSGMQYRMDMADTPRTNDAIVSESDIKVFVDPKSLVYLKGSTLDWEEDLLGGQFKITNPNAKHSCSCGLSFTI
jgi:iron-sulfur cluster assembly protein